MRIGLQDRSKSVSSAIRRREEHDNLRVGGGHRAAYAEDASIAKKIAAATHNPRAECDGGLQTEVRRYLGRNWVLKPAFITTRAHAVSAPDVAHRPLRLCEVCVAAVFIRARTSLHKRLAYSHAIHSVHLRRVSKRRQHRVGILHCAVFKSSCRSRIVTR